MVAPTPKDGCECQQTADSNILVEKLASTQLSLELIDSAVRVAWVHVEAATCKVSFSITDQGGNDCL